MKFIIAFLVATMFFLVLKLIRIGMKRLLNRYPGLNSIGNLLLAIELFLWLIYIFWATDFLFRDKFYYPYLVYSLMLIITGFVAWYLLRDIFAGIVFRVKHNLKRGSFIGAGDLSGQIKSQNLTYLKIVTGEGQLLRVPYSRIVHEVIIELTYPGALAEHMLHLQVDSSIGKTTAAEALIRTAILNTPWSNLKEEPTIKFLNENETGYFFEVTLLSINVKQIKFIEMALEEIPYLHVIP